MVCDVLVVGIALTGKRTVDLRNITIRSHTDGWRWLFTEPFEGGECLSKHRRESLHESTEQLVAPPNGNLAVSWTNAGVGCLGAHLCVTAEQSSGDGLTIPNLSSHKILTIASECLNSSGKPLFIPPVH